MDSAWNSEEYFDNVIEVVEGDCAGDSDKENSDIDVNIVTNTGLAGGLAESSDRVASKQTKTTKEQFGLIASFMDANDEEAIGKDQYNSMWDNLADELNAIGPPNHTSVEWRRIWSTHKYNKKRKLSRTSSKVATDSKNPRLEHITEDLNMNPDMNTGIVASDISTDIHSQILGKLVSLCENQAVFSNAIIERLDISNILLKDISESISSISESKSDKS